MIDFPGPGALALYRKHRPPTFADLVGQPAVVKGLTAAVKSGRVVHAYLFSGPRGTGKTSAARILAKCLNCQTGGPRPDPCGRCEACVAIAGGLAFDVVEIDAASNNGVEEIRSLRERVHFAPAQFRTKVYIVDEVHMLSSAAFNALLKTLEEPPEFVVFVLATTEMHKVPATILSRCQRYEFRRMTAATIAQRVAEVAKREAIRVTPAAVERLAHLADGSARDGLVLLEQARGYAGEAEIDEEVLDRAFGESYRELIRRIVDAVAADDAKGALNAVADAAGRGADPAWLAKELLRWFRLALLAQTSRPVLESEVPAEEAADVAARAAQFARSRILSALRNLSECVAQRWSTQPRIDLELALVRTVMPFDEMNLAGLSDRLRSLEERVRDAGTQGPPPAPAGKDGMQPLVKTPAVKMHPRKPEEAPASRSGLTATKLRGLWPIILSDVKSHSVHCFALLAHASVLDASDDAIELGVDKKYIVEELSKAPMSKIVAAAIARATAAQPRVAFALAKGKAAQAQAVGSESGGFELAESVLGSDLI